MRDNSIVHDLYALAARWTVHVKIDSLDIFTYFKIFVSNTRFAGLVKRFSFITL